MQKYTVNQYVISTILGWVQSNEVALPEIQRPFVWPTTKIRDLMDSLYQGYPIGYIIVWKNPDVRLKDGSISAGKKIIIDGQQRITALRAAILGETILDKDYNKIKVRIAFNPIEEKFDTTTPAIERDTSWISDISSFMKTENGLFSMVEDYCEKNPQFDDQKIKRNIEKLFAIKNKQIGFIELTEALDIETVTEIFIRINSQGVVLSQADFAMSKIASDEPRGSNLRRCIDYFCRLLREQTFFENINEIDPEFVATEYAQAISWVKNMKEDIYNPDYKDVIRVSFTKEFNRGRISDLVNLISGRDFETKTFKKEIADRSLNKLKKGVLDFANQTHYERFNMIIKSAGFVHRSLIRSQNALNFAYVIYLKLRSAGMRDSLIEKYVRKWFVMSLLTQRYSGSPETIFDNDIKRINRLGIEKYLSQIETSDLSDTFWSIGFVNDLDKSSASSPQLNIYWASQIKANNKGFLSSDISIRDMVINRGDIHHIFPRHYLSKYNNSLNFYNKIANLTYTQTEINIRIGNKPPKQYLQGILKNSMTEKSYVPLKSRKEILKNFRENCIPEELFGMDIKDYENFLEQRRILMAKKIKQYYKRL